MRKKATLRQKAREAVWNRKMPRLQPERMWGGPGTGARCTICDEPMPHDQIEFELEFPRTDDYRATRNPRVHSRCFLEWERACREFTVPSTLEDAKPEDSFPADVGTSPESN